MRNIKCLDETKKENVITSADSNPKAFVLWREVLMAYVAPAIMAGIEGLITGSKDLQIGALTTIGGTSAIVALVIGLWLGKRRFYNQWIIGANLLAVVVVFALIGAAVGLLAAWATTFFIGVLWKFHHFTFFNRVWIDFPLSANC